MEKNLSGIYKILRIAIFLIPVVVVAAVIHAILFPIEDYRYIQSSPDLSKFSIEHDQKKNVISFGVFPIQLHRYVDLRMNFGKTADPACFSQNPQINLQKTYKAFLLPEGEPISDGETLHDILFQNNSTKFPNGSLLHLKPTDEVFLISNGTKILFPGPEIFRAFGYSFENLTEVDKSTLDQFPDADDKVFLWTHPHPDETIFQAFPSHDFYIIFNGQKRKIENIDLLKEFRPDFFSIPVGDLQSQKPFICEMTGHARENEKIDCRFDVKQMPEGLGQYYQFTATFPESCDSKKVDINEAKISLAAEKSYATVKNSLRMIFASILNRYIYKQAPNQKI